MSEDIELLSEVDIIEIERKMWAGEPLDPLGEDFHPLCETARAAHKLKQRVKELESELRAVRWNFWVLHKGQDFSDG